MVIDEHPVDLVMEMTRVILFLGCREREGGSWAAREGRRLTTEVVDAVVSRVLLVQELTHVSDGVSVESGTATGRERHGNHPV